MPSWSELQKGAELARVLRGKPEAAPSVMDNYATQQPQLTDPAADAIGPPTIGGLSIDPTDYIGPGFFKSMAAAGAKLLAGAPLLMGGIKSVAREAPQAEALRLAQQRAALPVEQNGLGLPANNTPQMRADAMGAIDSYHGTNHDISSVDLGNSGLKTGNPNAALGFFSTPNTQEASRYATGWGSNGANVMPLKLLPEQTYQMPFKELDDMAMLPYRNMIADPSYNPKSVVKFGDMEGQRAAAARTKVYEDEARKQVEQRRADLVSKGYDSAIVNRGKPMEEFISMNPDNIRSRFAAFDPWRRNAAIAAAMGVAAPDLLAKERQ